MQKEDHRSIGGTGFDVSVNPVVPPHECAATEGTPWRSGGGNRNRDIAGRLSITEETVKVHVKHIMEKLGAKDRTEAVAIALRRGIIQL